MRVPQDAIGQRQLVYELALAIDLCMAAEKVSSHLTQRATSDLEVLLAANPRSAFSTHVLHNIGARRSRWLLAARDAGAFATSS